MSEKPFDIPGPQPEQEGTPPQSEENSKADENWQEVGQQFEALGSSLAEAFRVTWKKVETSTEAEKVKRGLELALDQVVKAIDETTRTPEAERVKADARKTAETLKTAGEVTVEEARPHIVSALRRVNEELQRLIDSVNKSTGQ